MKIIFIYLLAVVSFCSFCHAQQTDKLLQLLEQKNLPDTVIINTNNLISRNLAFVDPLKSLNYAQSALELSLKIKYKKGLADSYRNLGSLYSYFGSFYLTVDNLEKARSLYEELKDSSGIANCFISLGHAYRKLNNIPKEIAFHQQAYEIHLRLGNPERIGISAHNLGESYYNNNELVKATNLTTFAIRINDSIKNIQVLSSCYKVMGKILLAEKKPIEAEAYFQKIINIHDSLKQNSQKIATVEAFISMAEVYKQLNQREKEIYYLHAASEYVKENQLGNYIKPIYLNLIELYVRKNMSDSAIVHIDEFKTLSTQLGIQESEDKNKLVAGFTRLYEVEKRNNLLEIENNYQEERVTQKNYILLLVISISLVIAVFLGLLFRIVRKLRSINKQLKTNKNIIEQQNKDLAILNQTKDKFFGIVSHDLKAPLNSVLSFADLLIRSIDYLPKEQLIELSKELKASIENARKLTNDLVTWAHLQMKDQKVNPELFPATEIVNEIMDIYKDIAREKHILLTKDEYTPAMVLADKNQFRFIIRNLVNNAVKFTKAGGTITIKTSTSNNITSVAVIDTGIGMTAETVQSLFHLKTNQSQTGTAGESGTGLGLILLKDFVQLNKGSIEVSSSPGEGSVFAIKMPTTKTSFHSLT